jgi:hypothetical protein
VHVKFNESTDNEAEKDLIIIDIEVPQKWMKMMKQQFIEIDGPLEQSPRETQEDLVQENVLNEAQTLVEEAIPTQSEF